MEEKEKEYKQYIENIANGEIPMVFIYDKLKGCNISDIKDFCMKLYGRIPMGEIAISEAYNKDGHEVISSGLTMQQEREEENLITAIAHIESHFGFDTWGNEDKIESAQKSEQGQKKQGRPVYPIKDYIIYEDKDKLLKCLHALIGEKKGKQALLPIMACICNGYMTKPTFTSLNKEFGKLCCKTRYNVIMGGVPLRTEKNGKVIYESCHDRSYTSQEIEAIISKLPE